MLNFEDIRGALPYKESPAYVHDLVGRCKEAALLSGGQARDRKSHPWIWGLCAAAAVIAAVIAVTLAVPRKTPIERFLAGITDEEAAMIPTYNLEDIPEYFNE